MADPSYLPMDNDIYYTFDDIYLPSDTEDFLNSLPLSSDPASDLLSLPFPPDDTFSADVAGFLDPENSVSKLPFDFQNGSGGSYLSNDLDNLVVDSSGDSVSPNLCVSNDSDNLVVDSDCPISGNSVSPDSYVSSDDLANNSFPGPASSCKSGNLGSSVSPGTNSRTGVVDQKIKLEEGANNPGYKRKKSDENSDLSDSRTSKFRKSNESEGTDVNLDEDEKRVARLMRNRESAQLSRQRKKHYVEELEDKVRAMHSTIQDLNTKISYVMAENASLRHHQATNGVPPPGVYPWGVPCHPYMVKPQGSQVPLVPIPRLKPQSMVPAPKAKRGESKSKTKKVASVSLLGLLFFMMFFGGLLPMANLKFREINDSVSGRLEFFNNRVFYDQQKGRVLASGSKGEGVGNSSEPLVASLFVPRNDRLVKIDGNLIIHSVMASEKAMMASSRSEETGLAVARSNVPSVIPLTGRNIQSHTYRGPKRALSGEKDKLISSASDGKLQEWFREGLAGPMLSSGMCTEVFQFDISPAVGAIVPAQVVNVTSETQHPKNITTKLVKGRNRRILHGTYVPLVSSKSNVTQKPAGIDPEKESLRGNNSLSSMVVSVLVDPREAGDGDGDGVMGPKSISRIFVVVLIDSVKYVTYSCMLPLIGSGAHLVTT